MYTHTYTYMYTYTHVYTHLHTQAHTYIYTHTHNNSGSPTEYAAHKLKRGVWVPVVLRVTPWALERLDTATGMCVCEGVFVCVVCYGKNTCVSCIRRKYTCIHTHTCIDTPLHAHTPTCTHPYMHTSIQTTTITPIHLHPKTPLGKIKWRAEYRIMAAPAFRLLPTSNAEEPGQAFAVFCKGGRAPRVYAVRERHKLVQRVQAVALSTLGITLAGECVVWRGGGSVVCL